MKRIFNELTDQLEVVSSPFTERTTIKPKRGYHLWTDKEVEILGRTYSELYFAGIIEQKNFVSLHFMPIYMNPALKADIPPVLLALLKGKSCFHITNVTPELERAIRKTLKLGISCYKNLEWL